MLVSKIYNYINTIAPFELAESWDNCGLLLGNHNSDISKVMVALDVTDAVADEAIEKNINLIISHHPIIFHPLSAINSDSAVTKLIKSDIAVISAHTNLDSANDGIADVLCEMIGLTEVCSLQENLGRIGNLSTDSSPKEFAELVKNTLSVEKVQFVDGNKSIQKVAVLNGSEGGLLPLAIEQNADALLCGEAKYDGMIAAKNHGITLIAAGHFETEDIITPILEGKLKSEFPMLDIIKSEQNNCVYSII